MSDFGMDLAIINEKNETIGVRPSEEIHEKGLLHRALHILVLNRSGQLYVRRRSFYMELYPGVWTTSVGEHVFVNEGYDDTAHRALHEFLGLESPLSFLGKARVHDSVENELVAIYTTQADSIPHLNTDHSAEGKYLDLKDVRDIISQGNTTPHLAVCVELYSESGAAEGAPGPDR